MSGLDIPRTSSDDATPATDSSASVAADKYDQMLALADLFDSSGNEMRTRARPVSYTHLTLPTILLV